MEKQDFSCYLKIFYPFGSPAISPARSTNYWKVRLELTESGEGADMFMPLREDYLQIISFRIEETSYQSKKPKRGYCTTADPLSLSFN